MGDSSTGLGSQAKFAGVIAEFGGKILYDGEIIPHKTLFAPHFIFNSSRGSFRCFQRKLFFRDAGSFSGISKSSLIRTST